MYQTYYEMQLGRLLNLFRPTNIIQLSQENIFAQMQRFTFSNNYIIPDFDYKRIIVEGYKKNDIVYSIVSKIAKRCAFADWGIYKIQDDDAYKMYSKAISKKISTKDNTGTAKHIKNIAELRKKALVLDETHRLNKLYQRPNKLQGWTEYFEQRVTYYLLTGNAFVLAPQSDVSGFSLKAGDPISFNGLPSDKMFIRTKGFPIDIKNFYLQDNTQVEFDPSTIIHTRTFNPEWDMQGRQLYGMSPLLPAWKLINRNNEADDASYEILKKRGARKALGFEIPTQMNGEQALDYSKRNSDALSEGFENKSKRYKDAIMPIAGKINAVDLTLSLDDIDYESTYENALKRICNIYGINAAVFNDSSNSTYNNTNQYLKEFIVNCVFQILNLFKDSDNRHAQDYWESMKGYVIDYDPTGYSELQDDLGDLTSALSQADWLTDNEKRGYMNEGEYEGENPDQANNLNKNTNVRNNNQEPTS